MEDLERTLDREVQRATRYARRNYGAAYIAAAITVCSSVAATICVSITDVPKWATSLLAAIPAAVLAIRSTFQFETKAAWHWRKAIRVEALLRALKFENHSPDQVSREFSKMLDEMENHWVMFGAQENGKTPVNHVAPTNQQH
jgi:hypothetical protein